jgi:oxygen-independent coproporphyrinogen-3 oxidase
MQSDQLQTGAYFIAWPFGSHIAQDDWELALRYHRALCREIEQFCEAKGRLPLRVVYIGGELAGEYPQQLLLDMAGILRGKFILNADTEITIEVGASIISPDQVIGWREAGINRVCLQVPCLEQRNLSWNEIKEPELQRVTRVSTVIPNVAVELELGRPGIGLAGWHAMVKDLAQWQISHVSVYFYQAGKYSGRSDEDVQEVAPEQEEQLEPAKLHPAQLYDDTIATFAQAGLTQYGIYDFARSGYQTKFNEIYWRRLPYRGFGVGASSFDGKNRMQNTEDVIAYCEGIEQGASVVAAEEALTPDQEVFEQVMLGLSSVSGVTWRACENLSELHRAYVRATVQQLQDTGLMGSDETSLWLTPQGFLVHNQIVTRLLLDFEE